jgi:hypothetical protein
MKRLLFMGMAVACSAAANAVVIYSADFEQPTYTAGTLTTGAPGQGGWESTTATNVVVNGVADAVTPHGGNQMMRMVGSTTANAGRWAWVDISAHPLNDGQTTLTSWVWFNVPSLNTRVQTVGFQAYANLGANVISQISVNTGTGAISFFDQTTVAAATGGTFTKDAWHQLGIEVDILSGTVRGFFDGVQVGAGFHTQTNVSDFDTMVVNAGAATAAQNKNVYWDDYVVETKAVPEPATIGAVAVGVLGLLLRRRK